mmetsp:Transcript_3163/g.8938  ORF Transcript_3163/g.8938 Transcript_3163/m.8938 type:complete len:299 (+) Transcript_3163:155-1051(+)
MCCTVASILFLGDDSWLFSSNVLLDGGQVQRDSAQLREGVGGNGIDFFHLVLLDVHTDGGTRSGRSGKAEDDSGSVLHQESDALVLGDGTVDRVDVGEVVGGLDGVLSDGLSAVGGRFGAHLFHHLRGGVLRGALKVPSAVVVASVLLPVLHDNVFDSDERRGGIGVDGGQDGQPGQDCPDAILFADVVGSGSEALLSADERGVVGATVQGLGVHEVSKVLPSGRRLEESEVHVLGDEVDGAAGWHGSGNSLQSSLVAEEWDDVGVRGDDSKRIRRADEEFGSQDHVAVTITVGGSTE